MTKIKLSIYHVIYLSSLIDKTFGTLERLLETGIFEDKKNEDLRRTIQMNVCMQILLFTDSLVDEYQNHFKSLNAVTIEEKGKVEQIRELLKPVFKKISKWNELKDFRNNVLAHNLRIKKRCYESVFVTRGLTSYNIPEKIYDFAFLIQCIDIIAQVFFKVCKNEYEEVLMKITLKQKKNKKAIASNRRDYKNEYEELRKEVWSRKEQIEAKFSK